MKQSIILLGVLSIIALISLVGCGGPPEGIPRADIQSPVSDAPEVNPTSSATTIDDSNPVLEEPAMEDSEKVPVNKLTSSFQFEGFAPGKSHIGTFEDWDGSLTVSDGIIVGADGIIKASSVNTGIDGLDNHLKSDDFFDVEVHPDIVFEMGEIAYGAETIMNGILTFHGVTNRVSFPIDVADDGISGDFLLDTTPYNIKYIAVNKEVRLFFEMKI